MKNGGLLMSLSIERDAKPISYTESIFKGAKMYFLVVEINGKLSMNTREYSSEEKLGGKNNQLRSSGDVKNQVDHSEVYIDLAMEITKGHDKSDEITFLGGGRIFTWNRRAVVVQSSSIFGPAGTNSVERILKMASKAENLKDNMYWARATVPDHLVNKLKFSDIKPLAGHI